MLSTLPEREKSRWKDHVNKLVHAYNCTTHSTTGYSPYYLMFGRKPRLPIDIILRNESREHTSGNHSAYLEKWKLEMEEAYKVALEKSTDRKKKDISRRNSSRPLLNPLQAGDHGLVRNLSPRGGTGKMRSHWEEEVAIVVSALGDDCVVYQIRPEKQPNGKIRVLHRNMLMPCNALLDNFNWPLQKLQDNKATRGKLTVKSSIQEVDGSDTSDEDDFGFTPQQIRDLIETRQTSFTLEGREVKKIRKHHKDLEKF